MLLLSFVGKIPIMKNFAHAILMADYLKLLLVTKIMDFALLGHRIVSIESNLLQMCLVASFSAAIIAITAII